MERSTTCVNALRRAEIISTKDGRSKNGRHAEGVNALRRAEIISTVPSGNPHKYWAREAIFARNCLTI